MKVSTLNPWVRRALQVFLYELIAILVVTIAAVLLTEENSLSSLSYATITSMIAVAWNYIYNTGFEYWETRQTTKGRSLLRRIVHAIGFELGFVVTLVPIMAWWFHLSLVTAFIAEIGIMIFFLLYSLAFNWAFDKIFGLPKSAAPISQHCMQNNEHKLASLN